MRRLFVLLAACGGGTAAIPDSAARSDAPQDSASLVDAGACPTPTTLDVAAATEIIMGSDAPAEGIFDPSIVYPADSSAGAVAYSAVPDQTTIRTHLAMSSDHGATWTYIAEANTPEVATIASSDTTECPTGSCTGNLISEVPSLIYDADEPDPTKMWKLFAHRYLVSAGVVLHYRIGTITLQTAPNPVGPWTAPQKLIGWTSPASYTSTGVVANVNQLGGPASDCLALTEPGAIWLPGVLDLAVGCIYLDNSQPAIRIELLRSTDHGASWASVATLLTPADTACAGTPSSINGADLFATGGTEYVVASPSNASGYAGCLTFAIDDIAAGHVARDAMGTAIVTRAISASQFAGACTFADGAGGYALDVGFLTDARKFRIFSTP
jgi:hypothetical protein